MENRIAVAALVRRRAEKAGRINELERETETLRVELVHLDSVIRDMGNGVIDSEDIEARQVFPRRSQYFAHGEVTRLCYDVLRPLPEGDAVPVRRIVDHAMRRKGFNPELDRNLRHDFTNRFLCQLRALSIRGRFEKVGHGKGVLWRLRQIATEEAAD